jgi:hypothetical protein
MAQAKRTEKTLRDYGNKVVKESRALAEQHIRRAAETSAANVSVSNAAPAIGGGGLSGTDSEQLAQSSPDGVVVAEKKKKATATKVAHIIDKMLFNYRNIGTLSCCCVFLVADITSFYACSVFA